MKNSTLDRTLAWLFGPAYIVGILATFLNPNAFYEHIVAEPLRQLWFPLYPFVAIPLYGLFWLFPAVVGAFAFTNVGAQFLRLRISVSCLLLSIMYFVGNSVRFTEQEWVWLHGFMLPLLGISSMMVRKTQEVSMAMFGLFVLAVVVYSRHVWVLFDYVVAIYFLIVAVTSWSFPVRNTWASEEG